MPEVDRVLGNEEKLDARSFLPDAAPLLVNDIMAVRETAPHLIEGLEGRARAFVQVQQGCDHRCTFRSEEHTSELQSLMRNSYAVFCLKDNTYELHTTILISHPL